MVRTGEAGEDLKGVRVRPSSHLGKVRSRQRTGTCKGPGVKVAWLDGGAARGQQSWARAGNAGSDGPEGQACPLGHDDHCGGVAVPLRMRGPKARFEQSRGTIRLRSGTVREQAGDSSGIKGISRGNRPEKAEMTQLRT